MKPLVIGLDPGFDALKVVTTAKMRKFPNFYTKGLSEGSSVLVTNESYLAIRNDDTGECYEIGEYAKQNVFISKLNVDTDITYSERRFASSANKLVMLAGIGLALLDNGYREGDKPNILITAALPYDYEALFRNNIFQHLCGHHNFSLKAGGGGFVRFNIEIKENQLFVTNQAFAAMMSVCMNNEGKTIHKELWNNALLIFDGGFYTLNLLFVNRQKIYKEKSLSNTEYSMINIYRDAAEEISSRIGAAVPFWNLDYIILRQKGIYTYGKEGDMHIDVRPILNSIIAKYAENTVEYLKLKYDSLHYIDKVIVTGGTGIRYFEELEKVFGSKIILSKGEAKSGEFDPVFAIAVGCYRLGMFHSKEKSSAVLEQEV